MRVKCLYGGGLFRGLKPRRAGRETKWPRCLDWRSCRGVSHDI